MHPGADLGGGTLPLQGIRPPADLNGPSFSTFWPTENARFFGQNFPKSV